MILPVVRAPDTSTATLAAVASSSRSPSATRSAISATGAPQSPLSSHAAASCTKPPRPGCIARRRNASGTSPPILAASAAGRSPGQSAATSARACTGTRPIRN